MLAGCAHAPLLWIVLGNGVKIVVRGAKRGLRGHGQRSGWASNSAMIGTTRELGRRRVMAHCPGHGALPPPTAFPTRSPVKFMAPMLGRFAWGGVWRFSHVVSSWGGLRVGRGGGRCAAADAGCTTGGVSVERKKRWGSAFVSDLLTREMGGKERQGGVCGAGARE